MRADVGLDATLLFSCGLSKNDIGEEAQRCLDHLLVLSTDWIMKGELCVLCKGVSPLTILVLTKRKKYSFF